MSPYIEMKDREIFDSAINEIIDNIETPAEATYVIYKIIKKRFGEMGKNWNNEMTALASDDLALIPKDRIDWDWMSEGKKVLMSAYDEYHDKVMRPYEDKKEEINGVI